MEVEKKLGSPSKRKVNKVRKSLRRSNLDWIGKAEKLLMRADYYDTCDGRIRRNNLAFRLRREGPEIVATLKGKGYAENGIHVREEENIFIHSNLSRRKAQKRFRKRPSGDGKEDSSSDNSLSISSVRKLFRNPKGDLFRGSSLGDRTAKLLGEEPLKRVLRMRFTRRKRKLLYGESVLEVSADTGTIRGKGLRKAPIREIEIELISGNREDLEEFSSLIQRKYGLFPENRSKMARGLALSEEKKKKKSNRNIR